MSRSTRKNKIFPTCGSSEKQDKRFNNRMFRKRENRFIKSGLFEEVPYSMNEVRNLWSMSKDGKHFWKDATKKDLSK